MFNLYSRIISVDVFKSHSLIFLLYLSSSTIAHAQFSTNSTIPVGGLPHSVINADWDGNGSLDLVVANSSDDNLTILMDEGDIGFNNSTASPIAAGNKPVVALSLYINGDNIPDIVVANRISNDITVLIGNGNGGFRESIQSPVFTGGEPVAIASGDFDNDGDSDLAVANKESNNIRIFLNNNGFGAILTQSSPGLIATGGEDALSVASGDLNNDGNIDLVVANKGSDNISILLGNGNAGFSIAENSPISVAGSGSRSIVIGNFDLDPNLDLAVANSDTDNVSILLGDGYGGFSEAANSPVSVGINPVLLISDDWNNDGQLDLAIANKGSNNISILLGTETSEFNEAPDSPITVGDGPVSLTSNDFNNDTKPDLAVSNIRENTVTILINEF